MHTVEIDLNARTELGYVPAGFASCEFPLSPGEHVHAVQSDDEVVADAIVVAANPRTRTYHLDVKWESMRDLVEPTGPPVSAVWSVARGVSRREVCDIVVRLQDQTSTAAPTSLVEFVRS